jgi:hypothetical protein
VAATVFVAGEVDDIDFSEFLAPLWGSAMGGLIGVVPGMQAFANVLVNSALSGTANAFFTLPGG